MLFVLGGSSGAGKSAIRRFLLGEGASLVAGLRLRSHDFDEDGVPPDADSSWRQRTGAAWVRRALEYQDHGEHLLLSANWPLGEILATPRAPLLDGMAVCLIDCADLARVARLRARNHPSYTDARIWDFVLFAAWQRLHHADPQWMPEVILDHGRRWFGNGGDPGYPKIHGGRSRSSIRQVSRSRRRRLGSQGGSASRTTLATAVSSCCAAATGSHNLACAIVPE